MLVTWAQDEEKLEVVPGPVDWLAKSFSLTCFSISASW